MTPEQIQVYLERAHVYPDRMGEIAQELHRKLGYGKPTVQDIYEYVKEFRPEWDERFCMTEAQKYQAHYEACGWKVGNRPMKSWKAAMRTCMLRVVDPKIKSLDSFIPN